MCFKLIITKIILLSSGINFFTLNQVGIECSNLQKQDHLMIQKFDSLIYYKDSIIYIFNANLIARADQQLISPIHFKLTLPPSLRIYKTFGVETFAFYYNSKQVVFVYADRMYKNGTDTMYKVSNEEQISDLFYQKLLLANVKGKYALENNQFNKRRVSHIIKRGGVTILLYNILKGKESLYRDYLQRIKLIESP